jgi:predicted O-linked N-acetylglucosamine transferase (SPINDLY family)
MIRNIIDTGFEAGFQSAVRLGFPPNSIVIGVLQSFFKFTPDFEGVLGRLLVMTANHRRPVVLALSNSLPFNKIHLERLQQQFKGHTDRVFWFQNKLPEEWLNLVSVCHIMLDPFPFGGCNTSLEAFDYGIPVVCQPSNQINGRFTCGFYDVMGIPREHCCSTKTEEYLKLAYRLVDDEYYYKMVREKIRANSSKLFEQHESIREYQSVLITLVRRHHSAEKVTNIQDQPVENTPNRTSRLSAIQRRRLGNPK